MTSYTIWKKELDMDVIGKVQQVALPPDSILLSVGEQSGQLMLWFQFPSESANKSHETKRFIIAFTGMVTDFPDEIFMFKGSVHSGGFMYHVFSLGGL